MIDLSRSPFGEEEPRRNYRFLKHFSKHLHGEENANLCNIDFTSGQKQMPKIKFKLPELKPFLRVSGYVLILNNSIGVSEKISSGKS